MSQSKCLATVKIQRWPRGPTCREAREIDMSQDGGRDSSHSPFYAAVLKAGDYLMIDVQRKPVRVDVFGSCQLDREVSNDHSEASNHKHDYLFLYNRTYIHNQMLYLVLS